MSWVAVAVAAVATVVKVAGDQNAAAAERQANEKAVVRRETAGQRAERYLEPYRKTAEDTLPTLQNLINDPNAQLKYIKDNPLYNYLAKNAQDRLFTNTAARGKFNSGGTAEALQNALVLTGVDLLNKNISQRQELVNLGAKAASQSATLAANEGKDLANLEVDKGNIEAAGHRAISEDVAGGIMDMYGGYASGGLKGAQNKVKI